MTDPTQHALLTAICAHPEDDAARLVYADWLQENDQHERAEFIRVQVDLARTPVCGTVWEPGHPKGPVECRCCDLRRRERELWEKNGIAWDEPIQDAINGEWRKQHIGRKGFWNPFQASACMEWSWHRGFLDSLTCSAADWFQHADQLFWHPDQTVECPYCKGQQHVIYFKGPGATSPNWKDCPTCTGTGRIQRPFVPTAQPLTRVTLTDGMEALCGRTQLTEGGDWDFWEFVPGPWFAGPNPVIIQWVDPNDHSKGFTDDRWPGITFLFL